MTAIRVPTSRQGQTGMGQGGFTSHQFVQAIGESVTVALKSRIPLETDLDVVYQSDCWQLVDPTSPETVILEATRWQPDYAMTAPVTIDHAEAARAGFPVSAEDHPAPHCLSCGYAEKSLHVHAGPLGDGRFATPFRAPAWATNDGQVDLSLLWMAMDCSCGWYISHSAVEKRQAVTVQLAVDIYAPIIANTDYALVAWNGDYPPGWDGRKRGAAASLFDTDGNCIAQSRSFWVALQ